MKPGKTIWEMFRERWKGRPTVSFYNPLDLGIGATPPVREPQYAGYDFKAAEIREYSRTIGEKTFVFTDYVLTGIKDFDRRSEVTLRLRVMPDDRGGQNAFLLRLYDDLAYDQGLENVVRDAAGVFEVSYDEGELDGQGNPRHAGDTEVYHRVNDVQDSYRALVSVIKETDASRKGIPDTAEAVELEYWDFGREIGEGGQTYPQLLFVEMNAKTGWFQIWQGEPYYS
ncbi:MAG: hypothetical protein HY360_06510 [Verrucomicrobia bacterium]|nr:hypothetical protein [Verrucomicrobiota bacterium]